MASHGTCHVTTACLLTLCCHSQSTKPLQLRLVGPLRSMGSAPTLPARLSLGRCSLQPAQPAAAQPANHACPLRDDKQLAAVIDDHRIPSSLRVVATVDAIVALADICAQSCTEVRLLRCLLLQLALLTQAFVSRSLRFPLACKASPVAPAAYVVATYLSMSRGCTLRFYLVWRRCSLMTHCHSGGWTRPELSAEQPSCGLRRVPTRTQQLLHCPTPRLAKAPRVPPLMA